MTLAENKMMFIITGSMKKLIYYESDMSTSKSFPRHRIDHDCGDEGKDNCAKEKHQ